jgi:hypothetical protein
MNILPKDVVNSTSFLLVLQQQLVSNYDAY